MNERLAALLAERRRRRAPDPEQGRRKQAAQLLLADAFPAQRRAFGTTARQVAVLCTRRAGKSRGVLRQMSHDAVTRSGCRQVYVNTTYPECERIAWRGNKWADGLLGINEEFGLGGTPNHTKMRIAYPGDSWIELVAADNARAIQKLLGGAYHRVVIDEAQKMPHLDRFIDEVLIPAMMDFGGQIVLTGTPGRELNGLFYDVTREDSRKTGDWEVHRWSVLDNPFFGGTAQERWDRTIGEALRLTGKSQDNPSIQREWFGRWVKEDASYVYAVHQVLEDQLCYDGQLPTREDGSAYDWHYGLGVDIGYSPDPFAYVIWAWNWDSPTLYEVASFKQAELIPDAQAEIIRELMDEYAFDFVVGDAGGGGKAIVAGWAEGWHDRFPIPIIEAKKSQKPTYIEFLNNDIRNGNLKLIRGSALHEEMKELAWRQATATSYLREDKSKPNHCCDAGLYAHREAQHHRFEAPEPEPEFGTHEYWAKQEAQWEQEACEGLVEDRYGI